MNVSFWLQNNFLPDDSVGLFEFGLDEQSDNDFCKSWPLHNLQSPVDRACI